MAKLPIIVKHGDIKERGVLPTDWNDVTFEKYIQYLHAQENKDVEGIYEALTGISSEMWTKPHKADLFFSIDSNLKFTSLEPTCEMPTHIERNGEFYEISKDFLNVPLSKYRDIIELVNQIVNDEDSSDVDQVAVMPKLIAVFACKEYNSIEEIERIANEINQMPCDVVYTIGCFFLQKLQGLNSGTKKKRGLLESLRNSFRLVMVRLVAILVICITFIRYPRVMFSTLKRFLKRLLVRCTGGRSYRVESVPQIKNIQK